MLSQTISKAVATFIADLRIVTLLMVGDVIVKNITIDITVYLV